ncbi:MAG: tetrathionate reductase family octaheme c-type cytochrome, partial [Bacteroidales bacterium]|nr:tetrathionate reductase family octaheme c-type cytochrome [Bacteroidales bacterium]
ELTKNKFLRALLLFMVVLLPWFIAIIIVNNSSEKEEAVTVKIINYKADSLSSPVDHSKFEILQQKFETPQQVTEACLTCHNKTGNDIMHTSHWKWARPYVNEKGDTIELGKKNIINNFCIGIESNEPRCTSCHIGYGWKNKDFDFTAEKNIDCIICHDQTGSYKKFPTAAGNPVTEETMFDGKKFLPPNFNSIAQNVGLPKRENCGSCHYFGGGGNNVKHGDIEKVLTKTTRDIDIHMGIDGENMTCTACHASDKHDIQGQLYSVSSYNQNRTTCEQCHTETPHENKILNQHTDRVACQTCHIPTYAKDAPTKMNWDWSTAGRHNEDGSITVEKDSNGTMAYHGMKGDFKWEKNVKPEYYWFNGNAKHYLVGDKVEDTTLPVQINTLLGNYADANAKIIPVKVHRAKQIFDPINKILIVPHLFGKDSTSYWKNFDWNKASITGMKVVNLPYSGKYSFINTEMYWPLSHMVSAREDALSCVDCHSRDGRLANLAGFYMPGRDYSQILDTIGFLLIILSFVAVVIHGLLRYFSKK